MLEIRVVSKAEMAEEMGRLEEGAIDAGVADAVAGLVVRFASDGMEAEAIRAVVWERVKKAGHNAVLRTTVNSEKKCMYLLLRNSSEKPGRGPGRPKGAKNKSKTQPTPYSDKTPEDLAVKQDNRMCLGTDEMLHIEDHDLHRRGDSILAKLHNPELMASVPSSFLRDMDGFTPAQINEILDPIFGVDNTALPTDKENSNG